MVNVGSLLVVDEERLSLWKTYDSRGDRERDYVGYATYGTLALVIDVSFIDRGLIRVVIDGHVAWCSEARLAVL